MKNTQKALYHALAELSFINDGVKDWLKHLPAWLDDIQDKRRYAHAPFYQSVVDKLPNFARLGAPDLSAAVLNANVKLDNLKSAEALLKKLMPWRKGGFLIDEIYINTEWRSDYKWARIAPHIDLNGARVLDVGAGSGFHGFCMSGMNAKQVFLVEPSCLFYHQFLALQRYFELSNVHFLPTVFENLAPTQLFDFVFSMGVLYHRPSPFEHLMGLKRQLKKGGTLVIETLVVKGCQRTMLTPQGRYAKMNNVYCIPSVAMLTVWLHKIGYRDVICLDENDTTNAEQRRTAWMDFESFDDFVVDGKTVEGYDAPRRAVLLAKNN